jgi:flagellin
MKIQTNTAANFALRNIAANSQAAERSIQKLSSGFRINRAGDDAAGLALANKLRADGKALGQAQKNTAQGTAMLQTMDGAVQTISTILDRMKELATQANSANVGDQSDKLNLEFQALTSEIGRITATTKYQGTSLINGDFGTKVNLDPTASTLLASANGVASTQLNGAAAGTYTFTDTTGSIEADNGAGVTQTITGATAGQTLNFDKVGVSITLGAGYAAGDASGDLVVTAGASSAAFQVSSSGSYGANDQISIDAVNLTTGATGLDLATSSLTNAANAQAALGKIDTAIGKVNTALGKIGSAQSRFDFAASNVATTLQNTQAAESTIRDADMAAEMSAFTKSNILSQAAQAMLSQANQGSQGILQLLR